MVANKFKNMTNLVTTDFQNKKRGNWKLARKASIF